MKRTTALITAAVMLLGTAPSVFAEGAEYEKLLPDIKNRLEIPEEYSEFKCSWISETEDGTIYGFEWSIPEQEQEEDVYNSISVTCNADGVITSYSSLQNTDRYDYLNADTEAAKTAAESFAVRMNPALKGKLRLEINNGYNWGAVQVNVYEVFNGIEYDNAIGSVSVKSDGTVAYAYIEEPDFSDEDVTDIIAIDAAYNSYMENAEPELVYYTYTDEDKNIKTFPAYINNAQTAVSAVTGEVIECDMGYGRYFATSDAYNEAAGKSEAGAYRELTESEQKETARLHGYISGSEAVQRVSDFLGTEIKSDDIHLGVSDKSGTYYIYSDNGGMYINASVDASYGDILSISCYDRDDELNLKNYDFSDPETAKKLIEAAAPNNGPEFIYDADETDAYNARNAADDDTKSVKGSYFSYNVNGIKVINANASITCGPNYEGKWYNLSVSRLDEFAAAEYDAPEKFVSAGEALKPEDFRLRYVMTEGSARAAYITDDFIINAITGKRVNSRNEEVKDETGNYIYSDIENHWIKQAAEKLALAGIGFEGGALKPDEPVTAEEAYKLLDKQYDGYDKTFKDVKEPLTRRQTAQIITECIGLSKLAASDIFKAPYADTTEDFGAVAILKGFGIIAGDTDTFRPEDNITRAEFLQILYNTLITKQ